MKPQTLATIEQLEKVEWFTKVGVKDAQKAIVLSSWDEAIEHCSSIEWENLCLEACNQYRERLLERSKERLSQWNEIVDMVKATTIPLVQRKIETVVQQNNLPKVFENMVQWDMLGVCMESEFADVYPPGFYASQAYWYVKGHFPCGWQGEFPNGTLIVY
ncbi:MAG: hypothetical protein JSS02_08520 [Planctomycetes bacterium]|nr:hypothetical protein [Planctomycetota bacterium]